MEKENIGGYNSARKAMIEWFKANGVDNPLDARQLKEALEGRTQVGEYAIMFAEEVLGKATAANYINRNYGKAA